MVQCSTASFKRKLTQIHTGAGAYQIQAIPKLITFYHAAAGYPTKDTWIRAINRGSFATWPGLTAQRVNRYLQTTEETTMGHLQMIRQGIQSTRKPKTRLKKGTTDYHAEPTRFGRKKIHNICVDIVPTTEMQPHSHVDTSTSNEPKELIAWDLPGRYPVTSRRGHQYVFLIKDILRGFTACYAWMKEDNVHAKLVRMDNETSKKLIAYITKNNLDYQLTSPGDHRLNHAERAILNY
eukprot:jgi/Psemu1/20595/gm1.20595_g